MKRRQLMLYAIASCLSFNITFILSMMFYTPSSSSRSHGRLRRRADPVLPLPAADAAEFEGRQAADNWEDAKRRAEADAVRLDFSLFSTCIMWPIGPKM